MNDSVHDSKFYEERYHLEERERRRRLICNGVFIAYTLILTIGFLQAVYVEATTEIQVYILLTPFAILAALSFVAWIVYHIYSRRVIKKFYRDSS